MADYHEISFEITEDGFSLEMKTAEMSNGLVEAQRELFWDIVQVNYNLECMKFSCDCKKSLISKKMIKAQIDRLNNSFERIGKVMIEHGILPVSTDDWTSLELSPGEKFILKGGAIFSPHFLDKAVGD